MNIPLALTATSFIALFLYGCAYSNQKSDDTPSASKDIGKAEMKISQAIGTEIGDFKIVNRVEGVSAPAGFSEGIYTVTTNSGNKYKCSIYEPSGFMNVMSFGGAGSASAMCTDFTKGSKQKGKTNAPSCNDLLRAAGKC